MSPVHDVALPLELYPYSIRCKRKFRLQMLVKSMEEDIEILVSKFTDYHYTFLSFWGVIVLKVGGV